MFMQNLFFSECVMWERSETAFKFRRKKGLQNLFFSECVMWERSETAFKFRRKKGWTCLWSYGDWAEMGLFYFNLVSSSFWWSWLCWNNCIGWLGLKHQFTYLWSCTSQINTIQLDPCLDSNGKHMLNDRYCIIILCIIVKKLNKNAWVQWVCWRAEKSAV